MTPPSLDSGPAGASSDPYVDPTTGVLRNRLGISDSGELEAAEADFSAARLAGLELQRLPGDYDLAHLQRFHKRISGEDDGRNSLTLREGPLSSAVQTSTTHTGDHR